VEKNFSRVASLDTTRRITQCDTWQFLCHFFLKEKIAEDDACLKMFLYICGQKR